jgi:hypothetical protein
MLNLPITGADMNDPKPTPPPIPYATPDAKGEDTYTAYDRVADTVGMVPNVRGKDNLYQMLAGAICAGVGVIFAAVVDAPAMGFVAMGIGGFVVGVVSFGIYLAIAGLVRASRSGNRR